MIENYSSNSIRGIFDAHISKQAHVITDKWKGYVPLKKEYNITQIKSDKGNTFFEMNTIVHQVKAWFINSISYEKD